MSFLNLNGIRLHCQRAGQGSDVVMAHGLAANLAFWYLGIVPRLADEFCITTYDLRGHGKSDMPPSGYDQLSMSADLGALLDRCDIGQAHLVGHSYGGLVVLQYALTHPERIRSLTLADVPLRALHTTDRMSESRRWQAWQKRLARVGIALAAEIPEVPYPLLEELAAPRLARDRRNKLSDRFFIPFGLWNGASKTADRWRQLIQTTTALHEFDEPTGVTLQLTREFPHPVLLIFGARSRWIGTCKFLSECLPNCRTVVVPGVGHFHPLQRPAQFANHLRHFLHGGLST
jgi:pimeloyl-ACP methyl ester carboxylesterase